MNTVILKLGKADVSHMDRCENPLWPMAFNALLVCLQQLQIPFLSETFRNFLIQQFLLANVSYAIRNSSQEGVSFNIFPSTHF